MLKIKNKIATLLLMGLFSMELSACGEVTDDAQLVSEVDKDDDLLTISKEKVECVSAEAKGEIQLKVNKVAKCKEALRKDNNLEILSIDVVKAIKSVNIRESAVDGKVLATLKAGQTLPLIEELTNGWCAVEYNGGVAFICGDYLEITKEFDINGEILKCYYTNDNALVTCDDGTEVEVEKNNSVISYIDYGDKVYAYINGVVGYISKDVLTELTGRFVIVDESEQHLTMYEDNKVLLETPVVTGKPKSPTTKGVFKIYNITTQRNLTGPNYVSYVDYMLKFHNNEGLHDAEYHSCTDKKGKPKKHGWRNINEFGGTTYLTNGSHGCVNMPHEAAETVFKTLTLEDTVIVQK